MRSWANKMRRRFTEEGLWMAHKHIKRCSTSRVTRELQIKATMIYHYIPMSIAKIKNKDAIKCWCGYGGTGSLIHFWRECKMVWPLRKTMGQFLK